VNLRTEAEAHVEPHPKRGRVKVSLTKSAQLSTCVEAVMIDAKSPLQT
jgi:hypothetical protein